MKVCSAEPLIVMNDVSITYEGTSVPVLQDVSLTVHRGESVLFMGPSGCGKSTLAMLCAHLIPSSVEASVEGNVWHADAVKTPGQVGYVFQDPDAQFCMLQVDDELAFGLENQSIPRESMPSILRQALALAGLAVPFNAQAAMFSGGMKQLLAIACALSLQPTLLIFDEPTANLDPLASSQVFHRIEELHRTGQSMIVIEHKFDALLSAMDTVVLFDEMGTIHRIGPTVSVLQEEWSWLIEKGVVAPFKAAPRALVLSRDDNVKDSILFQDRRKNPLDTPIALAARDITMQYRKKTVWEHLDFSINAGELVAVVGPNGVGKSTLLQILAGLQKPSHGEVTVFDHALVKMKSRDRFARLAYCFQNPEFQFIYERVGDELANRIVGDEVPEEIASLLQEFGLQGTEQHSPFSLSQGQKRRLSVASMLRTDHDVFLLDEPTFGQDAKTQQAIMERLYALHVSGKTIVMTTHDMDLVKQYATKVLVLAQGKLLFEGTCAELFQRNDVLHKAHLLDDTTLYDHTAVVGLYDRDEMTGKKQTLPIFQLHPSVLFVGMFAATMVAMFAYTLPQAIFMLLLPVAVMMGLAFMTPFKIIKLILPFLALYVLYMWSTVANVAVPPGVHTINFLWYRLSYYGVIEGLILSIRMLGSVLFGILLVTTIDFTDLIIGFCKDLGVPPKFAYGTMAGLRVVPLFSSEWMKLRQARQVRGNDSRFTFTRFITYAIPLLSQGIRMSERVAIAMEARGFFGRAASSRNGRSFYRDVAIKSIDIEFFIFLVGVSLFGLLWLR